MSSQSRQFQKRILEAAQSDGYADLYWFSLGILPPALRQSRFSDGAIPGCYPGRLIPVIPAGPDPEVSRVWAELLCVWDDSGRWVGMPERIETAVYGGLTVEDQERIESQTPASFSGPEAAIAWGWEQGCFRDALHAQNAYAEVKREQAPKTASEMWRLWVAEVQRRAQAEAEQAGLADDADFDPDEPPLDENIPFDAPAANGYHVPTSEEQLRINALDIVEAAGIKTANQAQQWAARHGYRSSEYSAKTEWMRMAAEQFGGVATAPPMVAA